MFPLLVLSGVASPMLMSCAGWCKICAETLQDTAKSEGPLFGKSTSWLRASGETGACTAQTTRMSERLHGPICSLAPFRGSLYDVSISVLCPKGDPVPLGPVCSRCLAVVAHAVVAHSMVSKPPKPSWCLFCSSPDRAGLSSAPCSYKMLS